MLNTIQPLPRTSFPLILGGLIVFVVCFNIVTYNYSPTFKIHEQTLEPIIILPSEIKKNIHKNIYHNDNAHKSTTTDVTQKQGKHNSDAIDDDSSNPGVSADTEEPQNNKEEKTESLDDLRTAQTKSQAEPETEAKIETEAESELQTHINTTKPKPKPKPTPKPTAPITFKFNETVIYHNPFTEDDTCKLSLINNPRNAYRETFFYNANISQNVQDFIDNAEADKLWNSKNNKRNDHRFNPLNDCHEYKGIFTRELIDRYLRKSKCGWTTSAVRSHDLVLSYWQGIGSVNKSSTNYTAEMNAYRVEHDYHAWFDYYPIYYMIPKCGSSSVYHMMRFSNVFRQKGQIGHGQVKTADIRTQCGFAFVRNPVERLISGYYTTNAHLWRHFGETFDAGKITNDIESYNDWTFVSIKGEPERFRAFVNDLVSDPHRFTRWKANDHVSSQSNFLAYYLTKSDIHFIGRVETFEDHWRLLTKSHFNEGCNKYFGKTNRNRKYRGKESAHQMPGFGWGNPKSWSDDKKYWNWVEWMSLNTLYDHWVQHKHIKNIVPPAWFAINEEVFELIVDYYWQDYQCFGYDVAWDAFQAKRDTHPDIYNFTT